MVKKQKKSNPNPNRLIKEKSPYLQQHAYNPVYWYPWCDEAFEKAQKESKPIFLSIGYSTCHWCHVMEKESFEDPIVAKEMNDAFVSIKVDREERPDIDNVYMSVCQALTGAGGWPLTIIMTPDKKPFFAATYIPKEPRFNQPGIIQLTQNIKELWTHRNYEIASTVDRIMFALKHQIDQSFGEKLDETILAKAYSQLERRFDTKFGGFGNAPKFPTPHNMMFLLRYWNRTGNKIAFEMVEKTLQAMQQGGIYDHVGYGFHRYSTDEQWLVPHFEKMLYDQALIAITYIEAYQAIKEKKYEKTAREIFTYVLRDMLAPNGGFYTAEDADSEGTEGKFYAWTFDEIQDILKKGDADFIIKIYNLEKSGNYVDQIIGKKNKLNILHLKKPIHELAVDLKMPINKLEKKIAEFNKKLFTYRNKRVHPHKDDKILTDWNGLMIVALAKGAQAFSQSEYSDAAEHTVDFIKNTMLMPDGRLLHRYRDGEHAVTGFLNDYAYLVWGLIELYETTFNEEYLNLALELNNYMLDHFWDDELGGFYFTADNSEELILRQKESYDGALPSGNSVAFLNLMRLSRLAKEPELEVKAAKLGQAFSKVVKQSPIAHTHLMLGLDFSSGPSYEILVEGDSEARKTKDIIKTLRTYFLPNKVVHLNMKKKQNIDFLLPTKPIKAEQHNEGKPTIYVCQNYTCQKPTENVDEMLEMLGVIKNDNS